jgi:hypothetical protein
MDSGRTFPYPWFPERMITAACAMRNNNDSITSALSKKSDNPDEGGEPPVEDEQV